MANKIKKRGAAKVKVTAKQALAKMLSEQLIVGQRVLVRKENGDEVETVVTNYPWQTGYDEWVVGLEGFSVAYDITCIRAIDGRPVDFKQ